MIAIPNAESGFNVESSVIGTMIAPYKEFKDFIMIKFRKLVSGSISGLEAYRVFVEIVLTSGNSELFTLSGLPDSVVKESKTRVRAAIKLSGFSFPKETIVINLSPADLKKEGCFYDLAFASGIIAAELNIEQEIFDDTMIIGELSLNGQVLPIHGILPMTIVAKKYGYSKIIVPSENYCEASYVNGIEVIPIAHLSEIRNFFSGTLSTCTFPMKKPATIKSDMDFKDIAGQDDAKRALEIAASGKHNIFLIGPPGVGKTMLAKRLPTILPPMDEIEILKTSEIYSIAGLLDSREGLMRNRPFRAPHHSISYAGLVGGGTNPRPGEISLANNGVLFLDELLEFKKSVLEVLRQPLEQKKITISRAAGSATFNCDFQLITATNLCPCGNMGLQKKQCVCTPRQVSVYTSKLSSPLSERIDMKIMIPQVSTTTLLNKNNCEDSEEVLKRVLRSREIQLERYKNESFNCNSEIPDGKIDMFCILENDAKVLLNKAIETFDLSARSFSKIKKLARTIADCSNSCSITKEHVSESIHFNKRLFS